MFSEKVVEVIRKIPRGRVATYQQVAGLAGRLHAPRAVAWILNSCSKKYNLPWQRVVSKQGKIAFKPGTHNFRLQRQLLAKERVLVDASSGAINMDKYQWTKKARVRRKPGRPRMFED